MSQLQYIYCTGEGCESNKDCNRYTPKFEIGKDYFNMSPILAYGRCEYLQEVIDADTTK